MAAERTEDASARGQRVPTLSITARLEFTSAEQRAAFATALRDAVTDLVGRFSGGGDDAAGRPYRLLVGCHPIPPDEAEQREPAEETV